MPATWPPCCAHALRRRTPAGSAGSTRSRTKYLLSGRDGFRSAFVGRRRGRTIGRGIGRIVGGRSSFSVSSRDVGAAKLVWFTTARPGEIVDDVRRRASLGNGREAQQEAPLRGIALSAKAASSTSSGHEYVCKRRRTVWRTDERLSGVGRDGAPKPSQFAVAQARCVLDAGRGCGLGRARSRRLSPGQGHAPGRCPRAIRADRRCESPIAGIVCSRRAAGSGSGRQPHADGATRGRTRSRDRR